MFIEEKISVITVCYNAEKTIRKTIESVLSQKYPNMEYIIIDGKSTDNTMTVIKEYKTRISKVISEPDSGLYDAMNKGISISTGSVIGILNADDWYEPDTLEKVMSCFKKADSDVIYGKINRIDKNNNQTVFIPYNLDSMYYVMALAHPATFVRKEIYNKYGKFNLNYKIAADYELMLRFYSKGVKFQYLNEIFTNFTIGGMSYQKRDVCSRETFYISQKYLKYVPNEKKISIAKKIEKEYKSNLFNEMMDISPHILLKKIENKCKKNERFSIAIFGSGKWGINVQKILTDNGTSPIFFIDNNKKKWNTYISETKVLSPDILKVFDGIVLVMVKEYSEEISSQIKMYNNPQIEYLSWEEFVTFED